MSGAFIAIMMFDRTRALAFADQLAARGACPFVATDSDSLFEKAGEEVIHALVIDNHLKGFLTGLEITERLQAEFAHPVTILLAPESVRDDPSVQRLQIFQVESPSSPIESLAELTLTAAEESLLNRSFVCPRAQRLVSQLDGIQPLTPLILKIAASLRDAPASPESLFADVTADQTASAAVLRIVNSSAIGRPKKTSSVEEGIRFLGLRRTISAVLSAGLMQTQERLLSRAPKEVRRWYSRRGVLIASVSESFARSVEALPPETAYIHGLLQDAGILVLAQVYGDRYVRLLERVEENPHLRLESEERKQFRTSHADVTAALLRRLELPEALATISGRHHDPIAESLGSIADQALVRVMQIGEAVANIADNPSPQRLTMLSFLLNHYREGEPGRCSATLLEAIQRVGELSQILGLSAPDDHVLAKLKENVIKHDEYAPDSDFDPYQPAPVEEEPEDAPPAESPVADSLGSPKMPKVLVLEDDPLIAKFISSAFSRMGVEAVCAAHVHDALELIEEANGILCDIHLGDEDGINAVAQFRANGFAGPVIIITGDGRRSTVERACKAGISEYLLKPFTETQLLEKLQRFPGLVPST